MSKKLVIGIYFIGALAFLGGLGVIVLRLLGIWVDAPVEGLIIGGFLFVIGAKAVGSGKAGRAVHG